MMYKKLIALMLALVLFVAMVVVATAQDCYSKNCYQYRYPQGYPYSRGLFERSPYYYTPNYYGYWPQIGYYQQYQGTYLPYRPWSRPSTPYMICAQTDYYQQYCY